MANPINCPTGVVNTVWYKVIVPASGQLAVVSRMSGTSDPADSVWVAWGFGSDNEGLVSLAEVEVVHQPLAVPVPQCVDNKATSVAGLSSDGLLRLYNGVRQLELELRPLNGGAVTRLGGAMEIVAARLADLLEGARP